MNVPLFLPGIPATDACETAIAVLEGARDYRVLRPLVQPHPVPEEDAPVDRRRALVVSSQTTGLEDDDDLIELAAIPIEYGAATGALTWVGTPIVQRRDPHRPLYPAESRRVNLTDADLAGRTIDERFLHHAADSHGLVISFCAAFHRRFVARAAPKLGARAWACVQDDIAWQDHYRRANLAALLATHCGQYLPEDRAHAVDYATASLALLATPFADGTLPLQQLLDRARTPHVLVAAAGAPFESNRELRARGYRFHQGNEGGEGRRSYPKGWYLVLPAADADTEVAWLTDVVFGGRANRVATPVRLRAADRLAPFGLTFA